ncbi:hypothetical protein ES708_33213 [subsurface metagenome]
MNHFVTKMNKMSYEQVQAMELEANKPPKGLTILKPRQRLQTLTVVWSASLQPSKTSSFTPMVR